MKGHNVDKIRIRTVLELLIEHYPRRAYTNYLFTSILNRPELTLTEDETRILDTLIKKRLCTLYNWIGEICYGNIKTAPSESIIARKIEIELLNRAVDVLRSKRLLAYNPIR